MKCPAWIMWWVWSIRVIWRHVNGRWHIFRDVPDDVVIDWIAYGERPGADDDIKAVGAKAAAEFRLRLQLLDREIARLKEQTAP